MALLKRRNIGGAKPPQQAPQTSPFFRGYKKSQEEVKKKGQMYLKEIMFGGKKGFPAESRLSVVFQDIEPLSYYTHNMFSVGKKGFLTCANPDECLLCNEGIQKQFKSAWRLYLIDDKGNVDTRYIARGNTELQHIAKMADAMKSRCSRCGNNMVMLGGKNTCLKHKGAPGTLLTDWVFEIYRTGEGMSTKWLFDRDRLVDDDLREKMDATESLDLEKILAPKPVEYVKKALADLHLDPNETIDAPADEEQPF